MSTRKISAVLLLTTLGMVLSVVQTSVANAKNMTANSDEVESMIEITDIVNNEMQKSTDPTKFDLFYTVADNDFLWSPDGSKLLVLAHRNMMTKGLDSIYDTRRVKCGEFGLHERASTLFWMNADGSEVTNIARAEESIRAAKNNTAAFIQSAWWSSGGDKIVFLVLNPCDENPHNLYVSDRNGSILAEVKGLDYPPLKWSPNRNKINILDRNDKTLVYVIDVENSTVKQLSLGIRAIGYLDDMKWSPDGEKIAFIDYKNGELYTVDTNNSFVQQLTNNMELRGLSWKPDGKKLVLVAVDGFYLIDADGSNLTLIKKENFGLGLWGLGSWSPDGKKLHFSNGNEKDASIQYYVLDIEEMTTKPVATEQDMPDAVDNSLYFTGSALVKVNSDGTELSLVKNISTNIYSSNEIFSSFDGSRILFTIGSMLTGREQVYILKMKGYDEVMSIYAPSSIKQGDTAFIEVNSMSKPVENAVISLNGMEIGKTNETGVLKYNFKEAGNLRLSAGKQGFRTASKSIMVQELLSEPSSPEPTLTAAQQITKTATSAATLTPKAPGFDAALAIGILSAIYLFKRRYN